MSAKRKSTDSTQQSLNFKRLRTTTTTKSTQKHHSRPKPIASKQKRTGAQSSLSADQEDDNPKTLHLRIAESTGDIFSAPPSTLLIHACNCEGSWGAGIAKAFKDNYPSAFSTYKAHCATHTPATLIGTSLLIPPNPEKNEHIFIGCVFTSRSKGRKKDSVEAILEATRNAVRELILEEVPKWNLKVKEDEERGEEVGEFWMCKINSGLFGVPWERTREVVEAIQIPKIPKIPGLAERDAGGEDKGIRVISCVSRD